MAGFSPAGLYLGDDVTSSFSADPGGSMTWLKTLQQQLGWRNDRLSTFDNYYRGIHRLQFATPKFQTAFGGLFNAFADNWVPLVVDAVVERLHPIGFRMGADADKGDIDAQYIWQANSMDSEVKKGFLEAVLREEAYLLVWDDEDMEYEMPNGSGKVPSITVQDPSQCIVAMDPENRLKRIAAAKFFADAQGYPCATIYLKDAVYKYRSMTRDPRATETYRNQFNYNNDRPPGGGSGLVMPGDPFSGSPTTTDALGFSAFSWAPREVDGEPWPLPNPLGVVPMIPMRNAPRLLGESASEIRNVIPMQDAVNKFMTDMLLASEFAAFPQRWGVGLEGVSDGYGTGPGALLWTKNQDAKFGVFPEMTGEAHVKAIETVVQHIASQTRTPPHYFYLSGHFPSGDAIKSAEAGLVAKVKDKMAQFGEAMEEAVRLCFKMLGDDRYKAVDSETIWRDPESRTEGQHIDATVKKIAIGVPLRQLWEDAGYTQQQIDRFGSMRHDEIRDYFIAQHEALIEMAKLPTPDPTAISPQLGAPPGTQGAPTGTPTPGTQGAPVGLPVPGTSGQKDELVSTPGSPVAADVRGPRIAT
jgi:hypothetical protein